MLLKVTCRRKQLLEVYAFMSSSCKQVYMHDHLAVAFHLVKCHNHKLTQFLPGASSSAGTGKCLLNTLIMRIWFGSAIIGTSRL